MIYYGSRKECSDYYAEDITYDNLAHPTFQTVRKADGTRQEITLHVPGIHNVWNSLAAIACADLLGVDREVTKKALLGFTGTDRRFEFKGRLQSGTAVIDDYAHHPTEVAATLHAAKQLSADRIFVVFQPHTYTRTKALMDDFAKSLSLADVVILADIYAARETDTLGISSETLAEKIRALGHKETYYFPSFQEIEKFVLENCRKNDVLITMGAGNVNTVAKDLLS